MVDGTEMTDAAAIAFDLAVVGASIAALWVGAKLFVENAARIARRAGTSELIVGLTVVGFGTSTPELATSIGAALAGAGDLAVANVIGSNLFNIGVVLGLVSLWKAVPVSRSMARRDGSVTVAVAGLAAVVVRDRFVGRGEGTVLVALLVGYVAWLLARGSPEDSAGTTAGDSASPAVEYPMGETTANPLEGGLLEGGLLEDGLLEGGDEPTTMRSVAVALGGLAVILVGANFLVGSATDLARLAGVSEWVVGETVVAVGTSSPEIAASVVAARRGMTDLAAGNLLGSNAFNVLGILGASALVRPLSIGPLAFGTAVWLVGLSAFVVALLATHGRLTRLEGLLSIAATVGRWVLDAL